VGSPDQTSQRNIDVWEILQPGVRADTEFPLRNPLAVSAPIHLDLKVNPAMANWDIRLSQTDLLLGAGQNVAVTLMVTPPVGSSWARATISWTSRRRPCCSKNRS